MTPRCRILATLCCLVCLCIALSPKGEATGDRVREELDFALAFSRTAARAAERAGAAVLSVRAFGGGIEEYGSAILVAESGLALTAAHVIANATVLSVRTRDGEEFPAKVKAIDPSNDLALIELLAPGRSFPTAALTNEESMRLGESILVVGNPFGLGGSVTVGVLSGRDRVGIVDGCAAALLQTDAVINPGTSGGALVNLRGEVVGMIDAILTRDGRHEGIGFALPASELIHALPYLIRAESVKRAWIGLRVKTALGVEAGLEVCEIVPGGPAAKAGLRLGDRILRLDGTRLGSVQELRTVLRAAQIGSETRLSVLRGAERLSLGLTYATRP